ncbi:MFS general substrate transporter [Aspergillus undulatus]|uniref:MFS general substrate transporter n=1 Tax=Aspergillus undulatus TaxID=1810928 RepID=UPI003CCCD9E5
MEKQLDNSKPSDEVADTKHPIAESKTQDDELGQVTSITASVEDDRRVLFKLDMILIPVMGLCYMMQYMDKLALSQATLFGIREDLNLQGPNYSWTSAIFYFGYLAWSWPSSYLMVRLPIGKYIAATVFVWGGVLMCHAATKNYGGLLAARFFLGVGEASIAPGFALITGFLYKRDEQPARQAAWFFGNSVANIIGGVVAYGIGSVKGVSVNSWQLLFLALGTITAGMFFWLVFLLPDSPKNIIFLSKRERNIVLHRTLENKAVVTTGDFKTQQAWAALRDPQTWFLVLYTFCVNLWNGGTTSFSAIIINGFGFGRLTSLLLQMPMGVAQALFLIISAVVATFIPRTRILMMIFNTAVSMAGAILVWKLDEDNQKGRLTGLSLAAVFGANIPLAMSLVSANVAGFTKRSVTSVLTFVAYCVGNIVGPQLFLEEEEPTYPTGMKGAISGLALGCFFLGCLLFYYLLENKRRDAKYGPPRELTDEEELAQGLSNKTDLEIENFRYLI